MNEEQITKAANRERAKKAKRNLNLCYDSGLSLNDQIGMMVSDLLHLCERDGVNIVEELNRSQRVYKGEGGEVRFLTLNQAQVGIAFSALEEELSRLQESGEKDYSMDELQNKKREVQSLLMKLEV